MTVKEYNTTRTGTCECCTVDALASSSRGIQHELTLLPPAAADIFLQVLELVKNIDFYINNYICLNN